MLINWTEIKDLHIEGTSSLGKVIIRLNRKGEVTSMYTLFGSTDKYMPKEEKVDTIEEAKFFLEEMLKERQLRSKN
ncbi:MAG: hypothetical protein ACFFKA_00155 [Candidatus Thorarchaeota archaeon]